MHFTVRPPYLLPVWSGETSIPVPVFSATRTCKAHGPFPWLPCCLGGVVKTQFTDGRDRTFITFLFKCHVTIAWLGFKSLFTQVSQQPLKWRCLPGRANGPILIDCFPHEKDRCVLTCQVRTNKSIAFYGAGWQTSLPFAIRSIPFPGPPEKGVHPSNINKEHLSNPGPENLQAARSWQLKCVGGCNYCRKLFLYQHR